MNELKQIETMSLRDFIHQETTRLHHECDKIFAMSPAKILDSVTALHGNITKLVILQEIAYRLEYEFITEIGNTSLKEHLVEP